MARIPVYEQQTVARGPTRPGYASRMDVSSGLEAIAGAARQGEGMLAAHLDEQRRAAARQQDESDRADATERLARARVDAELLKQETAKTAAAGAAGYRGQVMAGWEKYQAKTLEEVKSEGARRYLSEGLARVRTDLELDALSFETEQGFKAREASYDRALDATKRTVDAHPDKLGVALAELLAPMAGDDPLNSARRDKFTQDVALTAAEAYARRDPYGTVKALSRRDAQGRTGRLAFDAVDPDQLGRLRSIADGEIAQREAAARQVQALRRAELSERVQDFTAAAMAGFMPAEAPSRADFVAAFGAEEGAKRYQKFVPFVNMGGDIQALAQVPVAQQAQLLEKYRPQAVEGFAAAQQNYQIMTRAAEALNKQRADDPAAYAIAYDPATKSAYEAMVASAADGEATPQQQQAAAQAYARQVRATQTRLGISGGALLPKTLQQAVVGQFYRQEQGGDNAAALLQAERAKWGPYWGQVWPEIAPDLPGTSVIVGEMPPEAGARLAEVSTVKLEDLRKTIPTNVAPKDISAGVRDQLDDYLASVYGQPGADSRMAALSEASERLAIRYLAGGKPLSAAVEQATQETILQRYGFVRVNDGTVRVPTAAGVEQRVVARALRNLTRVERDRLNTPYFDETTWATRADDSGVALMRAGRLVERPDGTPVVYSWQELANQAATQRETARQLDAEARQLQGNLP